MAFSNPIIGANDTLIRDAIQSLDYVTGISGWRIENTGNAEFNDVVVRGSLVVGLPTANQVIIDTSPVFGVPASIQMPTNSGTEDAPAGIFANVEVFGTPQEHMMTQWTSATSNTVFGERMNVRLVSEKADSSAVGSIQFSSFDRFGLDPVVILTATRDDYAVNPHVRGGQQLIVASAVQDVVNTITPQNDNELVFATQANTVYMVEIVVTFECAAAGVHARTAWQFPAGATGSRFCVGPTSRLVGYTDSSQTESQYRSIPFATQTVYITDQINTPHVAIERGIVHVGATAGNIRFRFAQGIVNAAFPIRRNFDTWMTVGRI